MSDLLAEIKDKIAVTEKDLSDARAAGAPFNDPGVVSLRALLASQNNILAGLLNPSGNFIF